MNTILADIFSHLAGAILDGLSKSHHFAPMVASGGDEVTRFIDKWAGILINNLGTFTENQLMTADGVSLARTILAVGILFVLGYELWPVIQGRRAPDIIVLLKPFLLFAIITGWTPFVKTFMVVEKKMTEGGRSFYEAQWQKMGSLEDSCRVAQTRIDSLRNAQLAAALAELEGDKEIVKQESEDPGSMEDVTEEEHDTSWLGEQIESLKEAITSKFKALWTVIKDQMENVFKNLMEWLTGLFEKIIKWLSCLYLQMNFYGIMMIGQIGMGVLALFGPIIFALSIFEVWGDNWARWIMQFLSYSLYGFLAYLVMGYTYAIVFYELETYAKTLQGIKTVEDLAGKDGMTDVMSRNFGVLLNWVVALWTGGYCMKFVPELAAIIFNAQTSGAAASAADAMKSGVKSTINIVK